MARSGQFTLYLKLNSCPRTSLPCNNDTPHDTTYNLVTEEPRENQPQGLRSVASEYYGAILELQRPTHHLLPCRSPHSTYPPRPQSLSRIIHDGD